MTFIDHALNRSRTVIATLILILVSGVVAFVEIPKEAEPDVNIPIVYVSLHHEGISPEDAERLLVRPMEEELQSIEGVKEMRSTAYQNGANVLLEFEAGFDSDAAMDDVREKVDLVKPDLPDDTDEPTVNEVNLSLFPVITVTLSGNLSERTMLRLARELRDDIEGLPEVLEANITGDRDEQVDVVVDPVLLESYGLQPAEILSLISRSNQLIAAGTMDAGVGRFAIKVPGLIETLDDILNMPLLTKGDSVITIGDIASVHRTFKDPTTYAFLNGKPAVVIEVSKRIGQNIIGTSNRVRAAVAERVALWPEGVDVTFSNDKSDKIRTMLTDLQNNVISAILLVMIVVVGALGVRGGLLVGIAIPGSFLTGILVLATFGLTVNMVVLFSLILAVGMLVDGAIVVTEYADRKLAEGSSAQEAYSLAAKRMALPIMASTATTLAAFMPLLFWPGIVGEFMKFLPITLVATLSASLAMALVFVPALGANFATVSRVFLTAVAAGGFGVISFGIAAGSPAAPFLGLAAVIAGAYLGFRFGGWINVLMERAQAKRVAATTISFAAAADVKLEEITGFTGIYIKTLGFALRHPAKVLGLAVMGLIGSWYAYINYGHGVQFFPSVEPEQGIVIIHGRGNMAVNEKRTLVRQVERHILDIQDEFGDFRSIYTAAGNFEPRDEDPEDMIGKITLDFADWEKRRPASVILDDIRARTSYLAGIIIETQWPRAGPPVGKPVNVQLSSWDPEVLEPIATRLRAYMDQLPGLKDVEDSRPIPGIEWELEVDRAQAAKFDADAAAIGSFVQLATKGLKISDYRPDDSDEEIDIVVRFPRDYRTVEMLDRIRLNTPMGLIPISNFVERAAEPKTGLVRRTDAKRIMYVRADVEDGVLPDDKVNEIKDWLDRANLPSNVDVIFKGEDEEQKAAQAFLGKAFGVALFIMAIILVTQFNSFYSGFLILSAVIMSTVGVLLGLLIMQEPFGIIMSGIGVIALAGIVVNNNIVLIDTYDRLHRTEPDARIAILKTGAQRLRPVLLTTTTTILGLMPMVLQINIDFVTREILFGAPSTQWWVQLSTAIAFGLAFATVLTLVVTPCALMFFANFLAWLDRRAKRRAERAAAKEAAATAEPAE